MMGCVKYLDTSHNEMKIRHVFLQKVTAGTPMFISYGRQYLKYLVLVILMRHFLFQSMSNFVLLSGSSFSSKSLAITLVGDCSI